MSHKINGKVGALVIAIAVAIAAFSIGKADAALQATALSVKQANAQMMDSVNSPAFQSLLK